MADFDWNNYLETTKGIAVPEELFLHVESSLNNGIKQGMLLEVCHKNNPDVYWIAEITMVCGHLLRIKFIGSVNDFWCDISNTKVHPLGWCGKYDELIEPPDEVNEKYGDTIIEIMKKALLDGQSVSIEALNNKGLSPIDRIKVGMKVEVQNYFDPYRYWIATVCENVGGRLLLQYDGADEDLQKFWIFFSNPRLSSFGYVTNKGSPWQFKYPSKVNKFSCKNKLSTQLRLSAEESIKEPTPPDLFQINHDMEAHSFVTGMKLETLSPQDMKCIRPATVSKVFNNFHFLVTVDDHAEDYEETKMAWLCDSKHPYIYPIGWAHKNNFPLRAPQAWKDGAAFDWDEYLAMTSSVPAPDYCFAKKSPLNGMEVNMKLEAANPHNEEEVHVANVDCIVEHMVRVELLPVGETFWCAQGSDLLFPAGWCDANGYALHFPDLSAPTEEPPEEEAAKPSREEAKAPEEWCDRIFFNYKCYAGPSISRNKLSQLPKHVGPGPLSLVLKEVLNKIISASYKPAKLLKDWEADGPLREGMRLELLRAKLKSSTYHARVAVCGRARDVAGYCRGVCARLQACPSLLGPDDCARGCPNDCHARDKSHFHNNTERRGRPKGSLNGRRKKRKGAAEKREKERPSSVGDGSKKEEAADAGRSPASDSENDSGSKNISDVSDSEEPELKKLKFTSYEPLPSDNNGFERELARLAGDPARWSADQVQSYLARAAPPPVRAAAARLRHHDVDGEALLLLDLPALTTFLHMKEEFAAMLARHIDLIRWYSANLQRRAAAAAAAAADPHA